MTYTAFLRGINVSGQKLIKMEELVRIFEAAGFKNAKTFVASGNVVFDATQKSEAAVAKKLNSVLCDELGYEVTVMLRSLDELRSLSLLDPFKKIKSKDATRYVTFLAEKPQIELKLPHVSPKKNVEIFQIIGRDVFSISHKVERGDYANPILEKLLKIPATTRNWNTVEKIVKSSS